MLSIMPLNYLSSPFFTPGENIKMYYQHYLVVCILSTYAWIMHPDQHTSRNGKKIKFLLVVVISCRNCIFLEFWLSLDMKIGLHCTIKALLASLALFSDPGCGSKGSHRHQPPHCQCCPVQPKSSTPWLINITDAWRMRGYSISSCYLQFFISIGKMHL